MSNFTELRDYLNSLPDDTDIAWDVYNIKDIHLRVKNRGLPSISDEQASSILETMQENHDANNGFNWDIIDIEIDNELRS